MGEGNQKLPTGDYAASWRTKQLNFDEAHISEYYTAHTQSMHSPDPGPSLV